MHCSVLSVNTVSTFGFKIIATAFQLSIKNQPEKNTTKAFLVQNIPVTIKNPIIHTIKTGYPNLCLKITFIFSGKGEMYSIQHCVIKFISDLWLLDCFIRVLQISPQVKWLPRYH